MDPPSKMRASPRVAWEAGEGVGDCEASRLSGAVEAALSTPHLTRLDPQPCRGARRRPLHLGICTDAQVTRWIHKPVSAQDNDFLQQRQNSKNLKIRESHVKLQIPGLSEVGTSGIPGPPLLNNS